MEFLKDWPDLLWVPVSLLVMERGKKLLTCFFVLSCVLLLRLQVEFFAEMRWKNGFIGLMRSDVFHRGLWVYSGFIAIFLLLAFFSKGGDKNVHLAASITILITALCVSTLIMVL